MRIGLRPRSWRAEPVVMVMMAHQQNRNSAAKLALFRACFSGLPHAYGTYDLATGCARQVKQPVTDEVLRAHLQGRQPYGVYLLERDRTRAVVADFDFADLQPVVDFVAPARQYGLQAYIERSKSKGHHVWLFFAPPGVPAAQARAVVRRVLEEIRQPGVEVFPKQDRLAARCRYGNFIYAPLFGASVPRGRTVFLDPRHGLTPSTDQWQFLEEIVRVKEEQLDEIIEINELDQSGNGAGGEPPRASGNVHPAFGLPPCAQRMLTEGVSDYQRVACFRLAVQLKKAGLPKDLAVAALKAWAAKNRPAGEKRVITEDEIRAQVTGAYSRDYRSFGCGDPAVAPYCDPDCSLHRGRQESVPQDDHSPTGQVSKKSGGDDGEQHYSSALNDPGSRNARDSNRQAIRPA